MDTKYTLIGIGSKFLITGIIVYIGKYFLFLYPLYFASMQLISVVNAIKENDIIQAMIKLIKALIILFAIYSMIQIILLFSSAGTFCIAIGSIMLFSASTDQMLKVVCPVISPSIATMDAFIDRIGEFEKEFLSKSSTANISSISTSTASTSKKQSLQPHIQVEELPPEEVVDGNRASNDGSGTEGGVGIRRRTRKA